LISYIKGAVTYIYENRIVIENNGIGYNVQISENTRAKLSVSDKIIKIFTYMNVKEDGISLFGFLSMEELDIFNKLISVSGVGPKGALSVLSSMEPSKIILAIIADDISALSKGQGIGKKTAQRIVLELKDKVDAFGYSNSFGGLSDTGISGINNINSEKRDAVDALLALGFGRSETIKTVTEIVGDSLNSSEIIKIALKKLSAH